MAANVDQAHVMLKQLYEESRKVGLKMNLSKTKIMTNINLSNDFIYNKNQARS